MDGLFRDEAVEAQHPQALGTVRLATPVSHQVWAIGAAIATVAIALWLCFGHYTRREHVTGSLVPQAGLLTVTAREAGVVSELNVKPGMHVRAGEALVTISGDQSSVEVGDTGAAVSKALQQQAAQLQATLAALPEQTSDQSRDLRRRIAMQATQVHQIDAQLALQRKEADADAVLIRKIKPLLKKGYVSTVEFATHRGERIHGCLQQWYRSKREGLCEQGQQRCGVAAVGYRSR
jgi:membrane fusion protein